VHQTTAPGDHGIDSDALLAAYQLLIETTLESGSDDVMLQRALVVLTSIGWPQKHRFFSVLLPAADSSSLRLAASAGGADSAPPPCDDINAAACLCGRALVQPGRLLCLAATTEAERPPCSLRDTGIHLVLPLPSHGHVFGVLHTLVDSDQPPGAPERSFLVQVASLIGAELHRRRSEREHDRLETQFLQAQKMEAVGRLAGGVAHDFNNILTAITNYADLGLLKLPAGSPLRRNFEEIIASSDRAAVLTQQLLAFSRRQPLAPRVIGVNSVIASLGKTLRRVVTPDIELSIRTDAGSDRIMADSALIEQLIINLVASAREAMPQGGAIGIATANAELDAAYTLSHPAVAPGAFLCLTLRAHGPGMAAGLLDALGGPGSARRESHSNVPLGVAAVNDIIQQCGGHAHVETSPDSVTTARICFPVAGAEGSAMLAPVVANGMPRGDETILLAEDDDSVRVVIGVVLRDLGYQVLEAREGGDALAIAAAHAGRIDLLLADLVMPGFGGHELRRRLAPARPGLRVIYISGVPDDEIVQGGQAEPGAVFLHKPFSPWSLASRLRQVLDAPPPTPRDRGRNGT
jgi:signal transduction histidine kinase/CheY-like chemotaxis protein